MKRLKVYIAKILENDHYFICNGCAIGVTLLDRDAHGKDCEQCNGLKSDKKFKEVDYSEYISHFSTGIKVEDSPFSTIFENVLQKYEEISKKAVIDPVNDERSKFFRKSSSKIL